MKKTIYAVVAVVLSITSFAVSPANAESKSLVIIDSYFNMSELQGSVTQVCVAPDNCVNKAKPSSLISDASNHGTAMAKVALKQNPSLSIVVVRASNVSASGTVSGVNGNTFLSALQWVERNQSYISGVSFSYSLSGNMTKIGDCKLSTSGSTNIAVVDPKIRLSISTLRLAGIPVFAATGNNGPTKPVSYPACITDTNSVGAGVDGAYIPSSSRDTNTDIMGSLPSGTFSYNVNPLVPQTTSSATVAVAAKFVTDNTVATGVVSVKP